MRLKLLASLSCGVFLATSTAAETRCHREPDGETCSQVCDGNGNNCRRTCWPKMKEVCVEVSPPPQSTQPTGGVLRDKDGNPTGAWGGATIPIK